MIIVEKGVLSIWYVTLQKKGLTPNLINFKLILTREKIIRRDIRENEF